LARQRLGQHFLIKGKALERIAEAACGVHTPLVVEIGPGRGALTEKLLERADRVAAIELDAELAAYLRARWPGLELLEANALDVDWSQWGSGVLTGNLPYYIATPIISRYLRNPGSLSQAVFLIQKEVAERITAKPGTREYGYFSVECQFLAKAEYLFTVAPGAFRPPPKVDSAVIRLTPTGPQAHPNGDLILDKADHAALPLVKIAGATAGFLEFVSICFRQKRKTLKNNLREAYDSVPDISRRAEELSVDEFVGLYQSLGPPQRGA
jgi:16S rRNA (adenine1518-N6/adenine1519-N6)-dimethyltransferase